MLANLAPEGDKRYWKTLASGLGWNDPQEISEVSARLAESDDRNPRWWSIRITDVDGNTVEPTMATDTQRIYADFGSTEVITKTFDDTGPITTTIDRTDLEISNTSTMNYTEFRVHELKFDATYADGIGYCNTC